MACRTRVRHDTGELPGHGPGTHRRVCSICAFLQVSGPGWGVCLLNREKEPRRQIWQIYEKFLGSGTAVTTWVCSQETGRARIFAAGGCQGVQEKGLLLNVIAGLVSSISRILSTP